MRGGEKSIMAGDYFFSRKRNVFSVARIVSTGEFGLIPIRVTIPEGFSTIDMAERLSQVFNLFDREKFLKYAQPEYSGYLYCKLEVQKRSLGTQYHYARLMYLLLAL